MRQNPKVADLDMGALAISPGFFVVHLATPMPLLIGRSGRNGSSHAHLRNSV